jgi:hypothetical protein
LINILARESAAQEVQRVRGKVQLIDKVLGKVPDAELGIAPARRDTTDQQQVTRAYSAGTAVE